MKLKKETAIEWADRLKDPTRNAASTMALLPVAWIDAGWKRGGMGYFEPGSFEFDESCADISIAPTILIITGPPPWVRFIDGRHRFSVLRDSGADHIWVSLAGHSVLLLPPECKHIIWRDDDGIRQYGKERVVAGMIEDVVPYGKDIQDKSMRRKPRPAKVDKNEKAN